MRPSNRSFPGIACVAAGALAVTSPHVVAQSGGFAPWRGMCLEADAGGSSNGSMTTTDDVRQRIVSFGCHVGDAVYADTWEWGGSRWLPGDPARLPPFRRGGAITYDSARHRVVMFGGSWQSTFGDTWEWNGETWALRTLPVSPGARSGCAAAYDIARGRVVLFGGQGFGDTWEYDGITWVPRFPAHAPSPRRDHVMAYDEQSQRIVLHGGQSSAPFGISTETWAWDGTDWSLLNANGPGGSRHAMVFDRARQGCVLFGGSPQSGATFELYGSNWTMAAPTAPFPVTSTPLLLARDPATGSAVAFANGQRWQWTGVGWSPGVTLTVPSDSYTTVACTDTVRNRVVACCSGGGTYEWDGVHWAVAAAATGMRDMPMVFDAARGVTVQFGGRTANLSLDDTTRRWNGTNWTVVPAASRPSPRYAAQMAYDAARQRIVLFGGLGPTPANPGPIPTYGDTWTFDGVTWTPRGPGPTPRSGHVMAYDPVRQVVVLHGGRDANGLINDETWEWNGTAWLQRTPPIAPPLRFGAAFAFDPGRGALVLTAGAWSAPLTDTWTWDGVAWTQVTMQPAVWPRTGGAFALDPTRQELLLLGGTTSPNATPRRDAQWLRAVVTTSHATPVGASCALGVPPRLSSSLPHVGNQDFSVDMLDANAQTPCCVGFATVLQPQAIGPCTLLLGGGFVSLGAITSPDGFARFPVPLPPTLTLLGAQLVAQGAALSATGPLFGVDLTAGRLLTLGD